MTASIQNHLPARLPYAVVKIIVFVGQQGLVEAAQFLPQRLPKARKSDRIHGFLMRSACPETVLGVADSERMRHGGCDRASDGCVSACSYQAGHTYHGLAGS